MSTPDYKNPKRTKGPDLESEERNKWLLKGREIYETWRKSMVNTPAKPEDMVTRFFVLRDMLTSNIQHKDVLRVMLKGVDESIKVASEQYPQKVSPKSLRAAKRETWVAASAKKRGARGTRPSGGAPESPGKSPSSGPEPTDPNSRN